MAKTLRMVFKNDAGRTTAINVPDPKAGVLAAEVSPLMDKIIAHNIFTSGGGDLTSKVRSEVVDRVVNVLGEW